MLENTKWEIRYVNSTWTTSLVQELQQYNVQLKLQSIFQLSKQRSNDSNIIENEITSKQQLTTELKKFNACRIFLQVNYLSEITTIDGKMLDVNIIYAKTTERSSLNLI